MISTRRARTLTAVRAGLARGRIELRQTFTNAQDLWNYLFPTVALLVTMLFMRGHTVPGTGFSLGSRTLPSVLGLSVAFGLITLAMSLTVEREDGTLLRAKAIPGGMLGYLIGKLVAVSGMTLIGIMLQLIPGLAVLDGFTVTGVGSWFTLVWVLALGLVAVLPLGAIAGSLLTGTRSVGLIMVPMIGLIATSGIFYPINNFPGWLQAVAQVFPVYWLGLGMRSALLPDSLAAVELGHSWRHLETVGVLGAWAIVGLVVAPIVLRRMARRESGSSVAARREKALQRIT
jgi:ABC-2 type transport system permease protein